MSDLPAYTIFALVAWIMLKEVREYFRESNCQERIDLARREGIRQASNDYRSIYNEARSDAEADAKRKDDSK